LVVIGCSNGTFKIVNRNKIEKSVEAHRGAILSVRFSHDASALATVGEDGLVKVWSKTGNLRAQLAQCDRPV